jgi:hypothetical protein
MLLGGQKGYHRSRPSTDEDGLLRFRKVMHAQLGSPDRKAKSGDGTSKWALTRGAGRNWRGHRRQSPAIRGKHSTTLRAIPVRQAARFLSGEPERHRQHRPLGGRRTDYMGYREPFRDVARFVVLAPKGPDKTAQGNALGTRKTAENEEKAPKGRNTRPAMCRPFRALSKDWQPPPRALPGANLWRPLRGE